jgi:phage repressor protein C with HTH and peptisase S24 domain
MERHERIARAIKASGKKKGEIAAECGVANSAVTQWINGDSKSLRPENLYALAKATGFRAEWLAIGEGEPQASPEPSRPAQAEDEAEPRIPHDTDYALIPQYTARGDCGGGYLNGHVEVKGGLAFKRDWLARMKVKAENLYVIYADGDSMEPYIFDGDVVLFDRSDIEPRDRQVYAIRRPDGGISIKRIVQQLSGAWMIRSDNQLKYQDEPVTEDVLHHMPILGRVIWRGGGIG